MQQIADTVGISTSSANMILQNTCRRQKSDNSHVCQVEKFTLEVSRVIFKTM